MPLEYRVFFDRILSTMWSPFRHGYVPVPLGEAKHDKIPRSGRRTYLLLTVLNMAIFLASFFSFIASVGYYNGFWVLNADLRRTSSWSKS